VQSFGVCLYPSLELKLSLVFSFAAYYVIICFEVSGAIIQKSFGNALGILKFGCNYQSKSISCVTNTATNPTNPSFLSVDNIEVYM